MFEIQVRITERVHFDSAKLNHDLTANNLYISIFNVVLQHFSLSFNINGFFFRKKMTNSNKIELGIQS